jgi:hypothetical protein
VLEKVEGRSWYRIMPENIEIDNCLFCMAFGGTIGIWGFMSGFVS